MWSNITINKGLFEKQTDHACLFLMPSDSSFAEYKFWHPSKIVWQDKDSGNYRLGYTDDFIFRLKKYEKNEAERFVEIDSIELPAQKFCANFPKLDTPAVVNC